ncbi:MAG: glycine cleavage system protein GcvH [Deltaproteobacteria bacterium]|nr:glycine cleavage system protein GcvH [Deltaproteobacteria bacterium]
MSTIRDDRRYSREHEWVLPLDTTGQLRVGITDHAQDQLGDVVFVDLPKVGTDVATAEPVGAVESVKTVSDIYSPVAGKIVSVNTALAMSPELINKSPYDEGWIFEIEVADPAEVEGLLDARAYAELTAE